MKCWPGGYIQSIETRAAEGHRAGKGIVSLHNDLDMVEAQDTSSFVRLLGMVDTANGIVPRQNPASGWGFPNLDLTTTFIPFTSREIEFGSDSAIYGHDWYWLNQCGFAR